MPAASSKKKALSTFLQTSTLLEDEAQEFDVLLGEGLRSSTDAAAPSPLLAPPAVQPRDQTAEAEDDLTPELLRLQASSSLGTSSLCPYWVKRLSLLQRPAARGLVRQLLPSNALGFDAGPTNRKGTLFDYVLSQKKAHQDKVILTRVGEFYETYGVDALMMIEYCGLNPMGNKAKAGCPWKNIQPTLDGLTGAGLTVAVVEELSELDTNSAKTSKLKTRVLAQIVSPGASTYLYDCCLRPDDVEFKENRPYVGLLRTPAAGFTLVEAHLDARTARVTERMTEEAVRMTLQAGGFAEPIYVQGLDSDLLRALLPRGADLERRDLNGHAEAHTFYEAVIHSLGRELEVEGLAEEMRIRHAPSLETRPRPPTLSTALQIGLLPNPAVPDLVPHLLPSSSSSSSSSYLRVHSSRFLRRWLLTPPPYHLADAMQTLCGHLATSPLGPPQCRPVPVGKLVSMLGLRQCNVPLFRDLQGCLHGLLHVLEPGEASPFAALVPSLRSIVAYESGLEVSEELLRARGQAAVAAIEEVVIGGREEDSSSLDVAHGLVPPTFFERNEEVFRNAVRPGHPALAVSYAKVEETAGRLAALVAEDFDPSCEIVVDTINNALMMKKQPAASATAAVGGGGGGGGKKAKKYINPTDRNRKPIPKRYTTPRVEAALGDYLQACEEATSAVRRTLQSLSDALKADLPVLITALHVAVVLQAAAAHVAAAKQKGWTLPTLVSPSSASAVEPDTPPWRMSVRGLIPYWMAKGAGGVANDVDLGGIFLLTAPNMSGKSTLMRSLAVAALLGNCGLYVPSVDPTTPPRIPRFDNIFVRTASYDVPAEGKSAFALVRTHSPLTHYPCTRPRTHDTHPPYPPILPLGNGRRTRDAPGLLLQVFGVSGRDWEGHVRTGRGSALRRLARGPGRGPRHVRVCHPPARDLRAAFAHQAPGVEAHGVSEGGGGRGGREGAVDVPTGGWAMPGLHGHAHRTGLRHSSLHLEEGPDPGGCLR